MKTKMMLLLPLLAVCGLANAGTINLGPESCGTLKQCYAVPTDTGDAVQFNMGTGYSWVYLTLNGEQFYGTGVSGWSLIYDNLVMNSFYFPDPTNPLLKVYTGHQLLLSATFSTFRTCNHVGRGQSCLTHWNLLGGTITQ